MQPERDPSAKDTVHMMQGEHRYVLIVCLALFFICHHLVSSRPREQCRCVFSVLLFLEIFSVSVGFPS